MSLPAWDGRAWVPAPSALERYIAFVAEHGIDALVDIGALQRASREAGMRDVPRRTISGRVVRATPRESVDSIGASEPHSIFLQKLSRTTGANDCGLVAREMIRGAAGRCVWRCRVGWRAEWHHAYSAIDALRLARAAERRALERTA